MRSGVSGLVIVDRGFSIDALTHPTSWVIPEEYQGKAIYTDFWGAYRRLFLPAQHTAWDKKADAVSAVPEPVLKPLENGFPTGFILIPKGEVR